LGFVLGCTLAFAAAAAFYPALRLPRRARTAAWLSLSIIVAAAPCIPPLVTPYLRFLVSLVSVMNLLKMFDLFRHPDPGLTFAAYLAYLPNWFWDVRRRVPPAPPRDQDRRRLAISLPLVAVSIALIVLVWRIDWTKLPVALEHCVKLTVVLMAAIQVARATSSALRLLGQPALNTTNNPFIATTPADFWRRWNRAMGAWFHEYAFRPAGGHRHPVRATLAAFAASALLHEYIFWIATLRPQAWQTAYFMLQGFAVAATLRLRPTGWGDPLRVAGTLAFFFLSTALFLQSADRVVPFYAARPSWGD
jgi:hypothetical protein